MNKSKNKPEGNLQALGDFINTGSSITANKPCGDGDNEEDYAGVVVQEVYQKPLHLLNFAMNLNTVKS